MGAFTTFGHGLESEVEISDTYTAALDIEAGPGGTRIVLFSALHLLETVAVYRNDSN